MLYEIAHFNNAIPIGLQSGQTENFSLFSEQYFNLHSFVF